MSKAGKATSDSKRAGIVGKRIKRNALLVPLGESRLGSWQQRELGGKARLAVGRSVVKVCCIEAVRRSDR